MKLNRILAAADDSAAGQKAVKAAFSIAARSNAALSLLHVIAAPVRTIAGSYVGESDRFLDEEASSELRVRRWLLSDDSPARPDAPPELSVAYGVPGIEICRFAEDWSADLIVVGRKEHPERARLLLGDTGDAVTRRSRVPTLLVPAQGSGLSRVLVALDGSDRGMKVLGPACAFARVLGAALAVVSVEPRMVEEPGSTSLPLTRSLALESRVRSMALAAGCEEVDVRIRGGAISTRILEQIESGGHDMLVLGQHRGGPSWLVQSSSTAQQLGHAAPCAVLTVPL
jgi:nucleotide-binding universal stress UspA family protein